MFELNATHDPRLTSWVLSANEGATDFPIQNLPYGRCRKVDGGNWGLGVAIGDQVLDLRAAHGAGLPLHPSLCAADLGEFMALPSALHKETRALLSSALREGSPWASVLAPCLTPRSQVQLGLPCTIGDYTDFFTGIHHARAAGRLFRPNDPLAPNYKWLPVAYHGRSSSIVPSGTDVRRPRGQSSADGQAVTFGPAQAMDYELELGVLVGRDNALGEPVSIEHAEQHWFGMVLLNDWSARDLQAWEAQPLGPFLAKNFATSISCWIVTREALAPFRVAAPARPADDPRTLPHLRGESDAGHGGLNLTLEAWVQGQDMAAPHRLTQCNFRSASYWTIAQMIAHHTSNGCNLRVGDLLGTGTQSGQEPGQGGCLLELTQGGAAPLALPGGKQRAFLHDGDQVTLRGYCEQPGRPRIGFGDCVGTVLGSATPA